MPEQEIQLLFNELQPSNPDAINGDSSHSDEHSNLVQESNPVMREIILMLEIASQAKRRPTLADRHTKAPTPLTPMLSYQLPPPVVYSRKNKKVVVP